jgi:hypothetical protein
VVKSLLILYTTMKIGRKPHKVSFNLFPCKSNLVSAKVQGSLTELCSGAFALITPFLT